MSRILMADNAIMAGGRREEVTHLERLTSLANTFPHHTAEEAQEMLSALIAMLRSVSIRAGFPSRDVTRLTTKFRDAGRRSAPWRQVSSRVPGRPQDGSDGNRINRWMLPQDHKFFATEVDACFVESKYIIQALSMKSAPPLTRHELAALEPLALKLVEHDIGQGKYCDPIMLEPIDFEKVMSDPRTIQSGHLHPLDRGGRHNYKNTFLMLSRSNQLQGNMTVAELIELMRVVVDRHEKAADSSSLLEFRIRQQ